MELSNEVAAELAGSQDLILRTLEEHLECDVFLRGNVVTLDGEADAVQTGATVVRELSSMVERGHDIGPATIETVARVLDQRESPAPLFDALHDMMEAEKVAAHLEKGVIEVAPLAFMRGRTLNDSFVILDEAQNTTPEQMKMFLTRLGYNSKAVITGDVTQVDLPTGKMSGLNHARSILKNIEGINFSEFTEVDVVRHPLVQEVIRAYDKFETAKAEAAREQAAREAQDPSEPE